MVPAAVSRPMPTYQMNIAVRAICYSMSRSLLLRCRNQAVPGHYPEKLAPVGWTTGIHNRGDITKVLWPDVGCHDDERAGRLSMWIAELMDGAAGGEHEITRKQIACDIVHGIPQHTLQDVDA